MRAGLLRHRVTFQKEVDTPDGYGGFTRTWEDVTTVWASVQPISGNESLVNRQLQDTITHKIKMRHWPDLEAKMRAKFGTRFFNIREIRNIDERNVQLELRVEEGVAT